MRITFRDRDGKGGRFAAALTAAGHDLVDDGGEVLLIDADVPLPPYSDLCDSHDKVVLYPHGAGSDQNAIDGQWPIHPHTIARLVIGTGQLDMIRATGYPVPSTAIGWAFCDLRPFRPRPVQTVLFAPTHPMSDGWMAPGTREANVRVFDLLQRLPVRVVVRFVGSLEAAGLERSPDSEYQDPSYDLDDAVTAVDAADLVLGGGGTLPNLAVARGTPTVMFGHCRPDDHQNGSPDLRPALAWEKYKDDCKFPLNADEAATPGELMDLMQRASTTDADIAAWRARFVGEAMDPWTFVTTFVETVRA